MNINSSNQKALIHDLYRYYEYSKEAVKNEFGGPSIYFHIKAIKEQSDNFLQDSHLEMIYATLASWGMHRMGNTSTKLVDFDSFKQSILAHSEALKSLKSLNIDLLTDEEYKNIVDTKIKNIFCDLKISTSNANLVANSKTLCHILPDLIPPIDRNYTNRFFKQDKSKFFAVTDRIKTKNDGSTTKIKQIKYRYLGDLPKEIEKQYFIFKSYTTSIKEICRNLSLSGIKKDRNSFESSYPKIADNLIVAFVKHSRDELISQNPGATVTEESE